MKLLLLTLPLALMISCTNKSVIKHDNVFNDTEKLNFKYVDIYVIDSSSFNEELISNGRIRVENKAQLSFSKSGKIISKIYSNGDNVKKGDIIARIDDSNEKLEFQIAQEGLKKAQMELNSLILGFGKKSLTLVTCPRISWRNLKYSRDITMLL